MLLHGQSRVIMRIIIMTVPFIDDQLVMIQVGSVWVPEAWVDQRVLRRQGSHQGWTLKDELFCRTKMKKITCAYSSLSCIMEGQSSNLVINLGMPEDQSRGEIDYWPSHPEQMGLGKWILFIFIINNSPSTTLGSGKIFQNGDSNHLVHCQF